jgi:tRNA (guanine-N(7)-)-methyltransferase subunit TRM82
LLLLSGKYHILPLTNIVTTTNNPSSVPALFRYELTGDNTLQHRETIKLPGNLLDVEVVEQPSPGAAPRLLVALDPSEAGSSSLIVLDKEEAAAVAGWRQSSVENLPAGADIKIGVTELQKILYSTDTLRKTSDFD